MMLYILSGWAGSGKDTCAKHLVDRYNYSSFAFADLLREVCSKIFDIPMEYFLNRELKDAPLAHLPFNLTDGMTDLLSGAIAKDLKTFPNDPGTRYHTPRTILLSQAMLIRAIDPNTFITEVLAKIGCKEKVVISDARFKSEIQGIKKYHPKAKTIRLMSKNQRASMSDIENSLNDYAFDYYIMNDGSLEQLYKQVDSIIEYEEKREK